MSNFTHLQIGEKGEDLAEEMLRNLGYQIIERNRKSKYSEIDIIAKEDEELVFVEVRTKTGSDFGLPEETIDFKKRKKLIRNAESYIKYKKEKGAYRIDVIAIIFDKSGAIIQKNHYKNITLH